jgi:hypothetical protein
MVFFLSYFFQRKPRGRSGFVLFFLSNHGDGDLAGDRAVVHGEDDPRKKRILCRGSGHRFVLCQYGEAYPTAQLRDRSITRFDPNTNEFVVGRAINLFGNILK